MLPVFSLVYLFLHFIHSWDSAPSRGLENKMKNMAVKFSCKYSVFSIIALLSLVYKVG